MADYRKTLRERIFGSGAYYEGGGAVPVRFLLATWLAFRLEKGAWHLRVWCTENGIYKRE